MCRIKIIESIAYHSLKKHLHLFEIHCSIHHIPSPSSEKLILLYSRIFPVLYSHLTTSSIFFIIESDHDGLDHGDDYEEVDNYTNHDMVRTFNINPLR